MIRDMRNALESTALARATSVFAFRLETYTLIDYFCDRRWLQAGVSGTEEGKKELFFRSGGNPAKLVDLCRFY